MFKIKYIDLFTNRKHSKKIKASSGKEALDIFNKLFEDDLGIEILEIEKVGYDNE